jgi:small-conductance mechanosensitive channel
LCWSAWGVGHGVVDGAVGFVAVAAVAFFAMWSVLSNLLCAILIFTVGPFRLGDVVELVDTTDKPGVKGRVVAINLLYTTLIEAEELGTGSAMVQVPNSLFFQRSVRRWRGSDVFPSSGSRSSFPDTIKRSLNGAAAGCDLCFRPKPH